MKTYLLIFSVLSSVFTGFSQNNNWNSVLTQYLTLEDALVEGNFKNAQSAIIKMNEEVIALDEKSFTKNIQVEVKNLESQLAKASKANSLASIRENFNSISTSMIVLAESKILSKNQLYVFYCPMKKTNWLDDSKAVKNPYYGKAMISCGTLKKTIN